MENCDDAQCAFIQYRRMAAHSFSIINFPFSISKWGRNGFDGGVEAGIAGRSGDLR